MSFSRKDLSSWFIGFLVVVFALGGLFCLVELSTLSEAQKVGFRMIIVAQVPVIILLLVKRFNLKLF